MKVLRLTGPVPPSINHAYATVRGRRVLSADGRTFKEHVGWIVRQAAAVEGWQAGPQDRFTLTLHLWFRDRQRRDVSNTIKIAEDAIFEALGFDDCRVDVLHVERAGIDKANPRCECVIAIVEETTV